ncbi:universal stress protein [Qipengyuania sp.]|uniref:universal stress protein n=1 Tax=Qipengyuania sp. TaxID=2004515 RepID=UPI003735E2F6
MRSILLHVRNDRCLEAARLAAFGLARALDGHVTCLQAVPLDVAYGEFDMGLPAQIIPSLRQNADDLRDSLSRAWAQDDTPRDWAIEYSWPHTAIPRLASLHDVVVMGACADDRSEGTYSSLAADLAIGMRTPLLLVPATAQGFDVTAPVVIAWNGSSEAANALRAALPLLRRAKDVVLLTIEEAGDAPLLAAEDAQAYLARHEIPVRPANEPAGEEGVAATIAAFACAEGAGCIVMGAYGRSRLREFILGGVSRSLLGAPPVPLLLAH